MSRTGFDSEFDMLYIKYYKHMCTVADKILHDWMLSEDVAQEVFLRVLRKHTDVAEQSVDLNRTYFLRVTKNMAIDFYRKRKRASEVSYETVTNKVDFIESEQLEPDDHYTVLHDIVNTEISLKHKSILLMKYCMQLSNQEISEVLHVSHDAVRTRLFRARKAMRRQIIENKQSLE